MTIGEPIAAVFHPISHRTSAIRTLSSASIASIAPYIPIATASATSTARPRIG